MARPTRAENEQKRNIIQFRLTDDERMRLKILAQEAAMNVTDFIKYKTLSKPPKRRKPAPQDEVLLRMLAELGKIGSNINQIARVLNLHKDQGNPPAVPADVIANAMHAVRLMTNTIRKQLGDGD